MWEGARWEITYQSQLKAPPNPPFCVWTLCGVNTRFLPWVFVQARKACVKRRSAWHRNACTALFVKYQRVWWYYMPHSSSQVWSSWEREPEATSYTHAALYRRTQLSIVGKSLFSDWAAGCVVQRWGGHLWQYGSVFVNADVSWLRHSIWKKYRDRCKKSEATL